MMYKVLRMCERTNERTRTGLCIYCSGLVGRGLMSSEIFVLQLIFRATALRGFRL